MTFINKVYILILINIFYFSNCLLIYFYYFILLNTYSFIIFATNFKTLH